MYCWDKSDMYWLVLEWWCTYLASASMLEALPIWINATWHPKIHLSMFEIKCICPCDLYLHNLECIGVVVLVRKNVFAFAQEIPPKTTLKTYALQVGMNKLSIMSGMNEVCLFIIDHICLQMRRLIWSDHMRHELGVSILDTCQTSYYILIKLHNQWHKISPLPKLKRDLPI